jgi:hypothetical protein
VIGDEDEEDVYEPLTGAVIQRRPSSLYLTLGSDSTLQCTLAASIEQVVLNTQTSALGSRNVYRFKCGCTKGAVEEGSTGECVLPDPTLTSTRGFLSKAYGPPVFVVALLFPVAVLLLIAWRNRRKMRRQLQRRQQQLEMLVDARRIDPQLIERERVLAEGSFGEVHLATWMGCQVAVKRLLAASLDDPESKASFFREINFLLKASHRNLVYCHGWGQDGFSLFLVMQFVSGGDLRAYMARELLGVQQILDLGSDIAAGMDYVHTRLRVAHRDLVRGCRGSHFRAPPPAILRPHVPGPKSAFGGKDAEGRGGNGCGLDCVAPDYGGAWV